MSDYTAVNEEEVRMILEGKGLAWVLIPEPSQDTKLSVYRAKEDEIIKAIQENQIVYKIAKAGSDSGVISALQSWTANLLIKLKFIRNEVNKLSGGK